jgi:hypothetical protein
VQRYHEMTRAQARAYFEQFMSEMDASRDRLAATLRGQGADPALAYDLTPESLDPMWEALSPLLAWQDGWEPSPTGRPRPTLEALGDLDALPSWLEPIAGPIRFSPSSIWILDGLGRHLGNAMVATVPGWQWSVGYHRIRAYAEQNRPVITAPESADINPIGVVTVIASRTLQRITYSWSTSSPWELYNVLAAQARAGDTSLASPAAGPVGVSGCGCGEHLTDVARLRVPFAGSSEGEAPGDETVTVGDLVAWDALAAEEDEDEPGRWELWFGDETRPHYDDDASLRLEDAVAAVPGVSEVVREDRETIRVRASGRCEEAMVAVAARALLDDRVRIRATGARP